MQTECQLCKEKLQQAQERIIELETIMYGPKKTDGLYDRVKLLAERVDEFLRYKYLLIGAALTAPGFWDIALRMLNKK